MKNIRDNKNMKYFLRENFKESVCFTPARWIHGNPIGNVYEVNLVDFAIASVMVAWLRDKKNAISFAKMIHQKIKAQEIGTIFTLSAENLFAVIKTQCTYFFQLTVTLMFTNPLILDINFCSSALIST